jgi:hypothetical protein
MFTVQDAGAWGEIAAGITTMSVKMFLTFLLDNAHC